MTAVASAAPPQSWPEAVFDTLRALDARLITTVPDAGHTRLLDRCAAEPAMTTIPLTTEEEGIAVLAGAWLGGRRGVLLMQSSGVGNCVNMLSLTRNCRFPLLMLITMRGEWGEFNPWQVPMGQSCADVLTLAGVVVHRADTAAMAAETVAAAGRMAFEGPLATAVLIAQRVIGSKSFGK